MQAAGNIVQQKQTGKGMSPAAQAAGKNALPITDNRLQVAHCVRHTGSMAPVQRLVIRAVGEGEDDIDTEKPGFRELVRSLAQQGNAKRLLYFTKYITAHAEGQEKIRLLQEVSQAAGSMLPEEQVMDIHAKIDQVRKALTHSQMGTLVGLLQRDTVKRTQQLLALHSPEGAPKLMDTWIAEEQQTKSAPTDPAWGNTVALVQPLINVINNILQHGILSREEAGKRGLRTVGSMDKGPGKDISVNTFALTEGLFKAAELAEESMGLKDRGSISVSMERNADDLLKHFQNWEQVQLTPGETEAATKEWPAELAQMGIKLKKQEKAIAQFEEALNGPLKKFLNERARGTIMAILDKATTGTDSTNVDRHTGQPVQSSSQEVATPRPQIRPDHIMELLVPDFVRPYFDRIVNPADIPITYVGSYEVDAHYKTSEGQVKIEKVVAPDYVGRIAMQLDDHKVISTHIITANPDH